MRAGDWIVLHMYIHMLRKCNCHDKEEFQVLEFVVVVKLQRTMELWTCCRGQGSGQLGRLPSLLSPNLVVTISGVERITWSTNCAVFPIPWEHCLRT